LQKKLAGVVLDEIFAPLAGSLLAIKPPSRPAAILYQRKVLKPSTTAPAADTGRALDTPAALPTPGLL
jgi:hypothetical protein